MVIVIYALRHATQKVSISALSKAQSLAPYMLEQYDLNNFSLTIVFNLFKKHKTLLVWSTKVLRHWTMSLPSRRDVANMRKSSNIINHLVSSKEVTVTPCIVHKAQNVVDMANKSVTSLNIVIAIKMRWSNIMA